MRSKKKLALVLVGSIAMSGCAAPPNTPGAGYGKNYTPVIDTQGSDMSRYSSDLSACRKYAGYVDADSEAMAGLLAGIVAGAALSAMLGGRSQDISNNATLGGAYGVSSAENKATSKQERILTNCMAGRGYRTLDGASISPVPYAPSTSPTTSGTPAASTAMPSAAITPESARTDLTPSDRIALGVAPPQPSTSGAPPERAGQWSYQVERLPEVKVCNAAPTAKMTGKGPGVESYTVACSNGDFLSARCEFGNCRVLK